MATEPPHSLKFRDEKSGKILIKCTLCDKNCDTYDQLEVHQKSKAHLKKAGVDNLNQHVQNIRLDSSSSSSVASCFIQCEICSVSCNTREQLEIHKTGKAHQKKALKHQTLVDLGLQSEVVPPVVSAPPPKPPQPSDNALPSIVSHALIPTQQNGWTRCELCSVDTNTEEQYRVHCSGTKHQRRLQSLKISHEPSPPVSIDGDTSEWVPCIACNITIHRNNLESHENGKSHKAKLIKSKSMDCDSDGCRVKKTDLSNRLENVDNLKLKPRKYQEEIFEKALKRDCVVFLPTGTGKTLIGGMLMLKMLEENPRHKVAFLVDKVLLVMQQDAFFKEQFEDVSLNRFKSKTETENRKLRIIGLANDFISTTYSCPIGSHDIIIATANLFKNLLSKEQLFWRDFSLVMLDEAHHCVKEHPYSKLLQEYHLYPEHVFLKSSMIIDEKSKPEVEESKMAQWKIQRCKIIGLTASPAGELDENETYKLLETLLQSLGDVDIVNVTENIDELNEYKSMANVETKIVNYNEKEKEFRELISQTFIFLLKKFERLVRSIGNGIIVNANNSLTVEMISNLKNQLMNFISDVQDAQRTILNHIMSLVDIIEAIDSIGYKIALEKFSEIVENDNEKVWFENNVFNFSDNSKRFTESNFENEPSSFADVIISECKSLDNDTRTILILVKERKVARELINILKNALSNFKFELLVGHGSKGGKNKDKGMTVVKQKKALDFIRGRKSQVIVATSVADEGIDLPECDLVIIVNPPTSVQALVQIRGRARKRNSRLLMLCRDEDSVTLMKKFKQKEENIEKAINRLKESRK